MTTRCYGHKGRKEMQNSKRLFKAKTQIFVFKKTHTSTGVTLNGQITLYLYNSIKISKEYACCV